MPGYQRLAESELGAQLGDADLLVQCQVHRDAKPLAVAQRAKIQRQVLHLSAPSSIKHYSIKPRLYVTDSARGRQLDSGTES